MRNSKLVSVLLVFNVIAILFTVAFSMGGNMMIGNKVDSYAHVTILGIAQLLIAFVLLFCKNRMSNKLWLPLMIYWVLAILDVAHLFLTEGDYVYTNVMAGFLIAAFHFVINVQALKISDSKKQLD